MTAQHKAAIPPRHLVVADPALDDYHCLIEPAQEHRLRFTLTSTGSSALRLAPSFPDALWLVNPVLPDMDGLDLLEMIRSLQSNMTAVVIDNQYDRRREQRALELQAIQYVCKPFQISWLANWNGLETIPEPKKSPAVMQELDMQKLGSPEKWVRTSS